MLSSFKYVARSTRKMKIPPALTLDGHTIVFVWAVSPINLTFVNVHSAYFMFIEWIFENVH